MTDRLCERCRKTWRYAGNGNPKLCRDCRRWLHAPRPSR